MGTTINRSKSFAEKMRKEGKVVTFNTAKDFEVCNELNKKLEEFRREYQVKERNSFLSASKIILTV